MTVTYSGVSAKICTYRGSLVRITFEKDTPASFASGENRVGGLAVKLSGLGQAAWTTKAGTDLDIFNGSETVRIVAPGATISSLEALARKIPGF